MVILSIYFYVIVDRESLLGDQCNKKTNTVIVKLSFYHQYSLSCSEIQNAWMVKESLFV